MRKNYFKKRVFFSFLRFSRCRSRGLKGFFSHFRKLEDMAHPTVPKSFRNNQPTGGFYEAKHGTPSLFRYVNLKKNDRKRAKALPTCFRSVKFDTGTSYA